MNRGVVGERVLVEQTFLSASLPKFRSGLYYGYRDM